MWNVDLDGDFSIAIEDGGEEASIDGPRVA